jgi:hypothetical protein
MAVGTACNEQWILTATFLFAALPFMILGVLRTGVEGIEKGRAETDEESVTVKEESRTMSESIDKLCIFLTSGKTFTFRNVCIETDNQTVLVFNYVAQSDGDVKRATVYKEHVAVVSVTMKEQGDGGER